MAATAMALGHEYMVLTDHSARLTIAHGLSEERLSAQLDEIAGINADIATAGHDFRILTGMEVDIFEDGTLDLADDAARPPRRRRRQRPLEAAHGAPADDRADGAGRRLTRTSTSSATARDG